MLVSANGRDFDFAGMVLQTGEVKLFVPAFLHVLLNTAMGVKERT